MKYTHLNATIVSNITFMDICTPLVTVSTSHTDQCPELTSSLVRLGLAGGHVVVYGRLHLLSTGSR